VLGTTAFSISSTKTGKEVRRGDRADDAVAEEMPGDAAGTEAKAEKKIHKVDFWMREERTTRST
jgi:hypothetical protein